MLEYDGNRVHDLFDPLAQVARQTKRYPLFHAKDGDRTTQAPGVGNGYSIVPFGTGDLDFGTFFKRMGAKEYHNPGLALGHVREGHRWWHWTMRPQT